MYGFGSPGGIVNYVLKRPTDDPYRSISVGYGSAGVFSEKVDLGGRFALHGDRPPYSTKSRSSAEFVGSFALPIWSFDRCSAQVQAYPPSLPVGRLERTNYSGRRIDSNYLSPGRGALPHVICYLLDGWQGRLMTRRLSTATRRELIEAVGQRYRAGNRYEKHEIIEKFIHLTGYHRKHAIRVLCRESRPAKAKPGPRRCHDDGVHAGLITLWEAADRICGKRLKAAIPTLTESMTRHGHLSLAQDVREKLATISAATTDRVLRDVREQAFARQRRRSGGVGNAIRRAVPIRTFADWNDP
jgi:hypothetical protein